MKQGIAVYMLYLYEGEWSGEGIRAMADTVKSAMCFSAEEYRKGMYEHTKENDLFYEVFSKWKALVHMESDVRIHAIKRIACLLEKRVEGVMGAKQRFMTSYKEKYFRRSAFREAMKDYGWMDTKRK